MKRLYESILNSTNTGKRVMIAKWLEDHYLSKSCTIESDDTITVDENKVRDLTLRFEDYTELPDYIQFNPLKFRGVVIRSSMIGEQCYVKKITSLRGLPKKARYLHIYSDTKTISDIDIELYNDNDFKTTFSFRSNARKKECTFDNCKIKLLSKQNTIFNNTIFKGDIEILGDIKKINIATPFKSDITNEVKKYLKNVEKIDCGYEWRKEVSKQCVKKTDMKSLFDKYFYYVDINKVLMIEYKENEILLNKKDFWFLTTCPFELHR